MQPVVQPVVQEPDGAIGRRASRFLYPRPLLQPCMQVVPDLQELSLLRDSLKQLDDLFLVVVVGEFNSGKGFGDGLGGRAAGVRGRSEVQQWCLRGGGLGCMIEGYIAV